LTLKNWKTLAMVKRERHTRKEVAVVMLTAEEMLSPEAAEVAETVMRQMTRPHNHSPQAQEIETRISVWRQ
jgi:hypothetical protein